jgi:hypothetical protein
MSEHVQEDHVEGRLQVPRRRVLRSAEVGAHLYPVGVSVPFVSFTVTPAINGAHSIVHYILFATFFYLGFIRK